ncbi:MAG: hypothetical protein SFU85_04080 [Candidatus Methylacidiphilales bacterium]|nr:hypothetical protein [Candidatus Methylacidiphilales bacterium]
MFKRLSRTGREEWIWAGLLVWSVVPFFWFDQIPAVDVPAHQYTAYLIGHLLQGGGGPLGRVFEAVWKPWPNGLSCVVLGILQQVVGWVWAGKIMMAATCLAIPLSFRYLLQRLGVASPIPAFWVLPLVHHHLLYLGFLNFIWGLALMMLLLGYWTGRDSFSFKAWLFFVVLTLVLYFCHPLAWILALGMGLGLIGIEPRQRWTRVWHFMAGWIPSALLMLWYLSVSPQIGMGDRNPAGQLLFNGLFLGVALPFPGLVDSAAVVCFAVFVLICSVWVIWKVWKSPAARPDLFLVYAVLAFALVVLMPDKSAGGSLIQYRLLLVPWLLFLVWLACRVESMPYLSSTGAVLSVVVAMVLWLRIWGVFSDYQQPSGAFQKLLDPIPDNRSLLVVTSVGFREHLGMRTNFWEHAYLNVAANGKRIACLNHYQARVHGFPVRFRASMNPHRSLGYAESGVQGLNFRAYQRSSGFYPDYVLLLGDDDPGVIREYYEWIAQVRTNGWSASLWKMKDR